jgi:hypothetical protein
MVNVSNVFQHPSPTKQRDVINIGQIWGSWMAQFPTPSCFHHTVLVDLNGSFFFYDLTSRDATLTTVFFFGLKQLQECGDKIQSLKFARE